MDDFAATISFKIIDNETLEASNVLETRTFSKIKDIDGLDFQISSKNYIKNTI